MNEESAAKYALEEAAIASASPNNMTPSAKPSMNLNNCSQDQGIDNLVYECCWDNCDWQFEDLTDCIDHCIQEPNGHVHQHFANIPPQGKVLQNTGCFIHSSDFQNKDMIVIRCHYWCTYNHSLTCGWQRGCQCTSSIFFFFLAT